VKRLRCGGAFFVGEGAEELLDSHPRREESLRRIFAPRMGHPHLDGAPASGWGTRIWMGHPHLGGSERFEEGGDEGDGQADDVEVVTLDAGNPAGGAALYGVGSGFVHWLTGGDVGGDVGFGQREEADSGDFGGDFGAGGGDDGDAGDDVMGSAGEKTEDAGGIGIVFRFAEDVVVEGDGGVGTEDDEPCV